MGSPSPDELIRVADLCLAALEPVAGSDWTARAGRLEWSCRQTLEHLCSLAYTSQLATRAQSFRPMALQVVQAAPIDQLLWTMHVGAVVLAEVARAAPPAARAFHPAGMADASGWVAMGMDEWLIHTGDIAAGLAGANDGTSGPDAIGKTPWGAAAVWGPRGGFYLSPP